MSHRSLASPVAVAVSGGPDSMALLHLLHSVGFSVVAVTVDHGLRADSAAEACAVADWCKKQKIEHHILSWRGPKPQSALHESARAARYGLLEDFCRARGILHLATAHHADDQAETILQRIAKASGPHGLGGMTEHSFTPHLHLWRPLLRHPKQDLVDYCHHFDLPYARDASNENPKFARGRLRGAAAVLAAEGLTAENLCLLAEKQRAASDILQTQAAHWLAQHARLIPSEQAALCHRPFAAAPPVVQMMAMEYALHLVSGRATPLRYGSLRDLCAAAAQSGFRGKTLGYCQIKLRRGVISIASEKSTSGAASEV